jgi:hypothetical protein
MPPASLAFHESTLEHKDDGVRSQSASAAGRDMTPREWMLVIGATVLEACFIAFVVWGFL